MYQRKFAIILTTGNQQKVLRWFQSKDEAEAFGNAYFAEETQHTGAVLSVEGFLMSEDGNTISPHRRIYAVWER